MINGQAMSKVEFANFCKILRTAYPAANILPNEQSMEIWYRMLCDIPYDVASTALQLWISENKWAPAISDIRETVASLTVEEDDWGSGWKEVMDAVGRFGVFRPEEALDSMSEITRETVKRIGYTNICMSENLSVDRASFRNCYETLQKRSKREAQLPAELRAKIKEIGNADNKKLCGSSRAKVNLFPVLQDYRKANNEEKQYADGKKSKDREMDSNPIEAIQEIRKGLSEVFKPEA